VRRERGGKVGHAGTLDPFATGLLIVLLGRATRLQRFFMALPKTYVASARLGWRSSTGDPDGELSETGRVPQALELPTGQVTQRLPMTSAARVDGERLYKKAHRGETVETPERTVTVHRADLLARAETTASFEIECSSGTYIRTLVETLQDAYCDQLRRTAIGPFRVDGAGSELGIDEALSFLPERTLDSEEARLVGHGRSLPGAGEEVVRLTHEGRVLAVGERRGEETRPTVVLV